MVKPNNRLNVSRRDFLKGVGAASLLAAVGGSIPLGLFSESCTSSNPAGSGTFTVNLAGEPDTIDPNLTSWASAITVLNRCYEGLLGFNKDLTLRNVIATQMPSTSNGGISSDGLTYTFKINSKAVWSDATPIKAQDFAYSIVRMLDPSLAAVYASFYYCIAGAQDYNGYTGTDATKLATLKAAVGVSAPDDSTLVVKLANPQATFLQLMALWPAYPLRQDVIEKYGNSWTDAGKFMSNGPWILSEWVHQDHMTFTPNTNYWQTKPKLDKIVFQMIVDVNAAWAAYLNNELDLGQPPGGTEKTVMADPVLSKQIIRYNTLTTFALQFNVHMAPFDNATLRQALSCGIDRQAYINQVRNGIGKVALSWIPPGMPGYNPNIGTDYTFNATKAQQLLSQAGYPNAKGLPAISFQYANSGLNPQLAQFLQQQLQTNMNINLTLQPMEPKSFSGLVNANQASWSWTGWSADYPDPDDWLPSCFLTGAGNNHTTYSNPTFDALAAKALVNLDNTSRLQQWDQAQTIIMNDAPIVTFFYQERFNCLKPWVQGFTTTGMDSQVAGDRYYELITIASSNSQTTGVITTPATSTAATTTPASTT